jgi:hypothetical protein
MPIAASPRAGSLAATTWRHTFFGDADRRITPPRGSNTPFVMMPIAASRRRSAAPIRRHADSTYTPGGDADRRITRRTAVAPVRCTRPVVMPIAASARIAAHRECTGG